MLTIGNARRPPSTVTVGSALQRFRRTGVGTEAKRLILKAHNYMIMSRRYVSIRLVTHLWLLPHQFEAQAPQYEKFYKALQIAVRSSGDHIR